MTTKTNPEKIHHPTATHKEWLTARLALLQEEKELTRRSDELAQKRQQLPWVPVEKQYHFDTDNGPATLPDLFLGRSQLLIYHFMFGPDFAAGCISCTAIADGFNNFVPHLANHDVTLACVSRAPLPKLQAYKKRMNWSFPWSSSSDAHFNADFNASFTEQQQRAGIEYNYRQEPPAKPQKVETPKTRQWTGDKNNPIKTGVALFAEQSGTDPHTYIRERPGMSAFILDNGILYHTYSTYSRGLDALWGMYQWLDRAPLGRNESGLWWRRRDEY